MDVYEEVYVGWWVADGKVVFQLGDGVNDPGLCCTIHIFAVFGTLCVGQLEDCNMVVMLFHGSSDIRALDVYGQVEVVERGDGELACLCQGEEGGGKASSHRCVKWILGVQFAKEHLNERQHESPAWDALR